MTPLPRPQTMYRDIAVPIFAILLASLGTSIANVALPHLASAFAAPFSTVQWVVIAYLLALTVCSAGAGRFGDRIGHARALRMGVVVFTLGALAGAMAPQIWFLILARMVQGVGAALMIVLPMALLRDKAAPENLGRAMGLLGTASAIGTALGPALGGLLVAGFGWRAIFGLMAALGLLCLWLGRDEGVVAKPAPVAGAIDLRGGMAFGAAIAGFALTMTTPFGAISMGLLLASGISLLVFLRLERRAATPFIPAGALADAGLRRGLVANALVAAVMMTTLVVGPFYLARGLGLGSGTVGLVLAVGPVLSALSGVPAGRLVDRLGAARVAQLGVAAMAFAVALIAVLVPQFGLVGYLCGIAILTPGYQLFLAANTTLVLTKAGAAIRGAISGLLGLSRNLGLIMGAAGMGALFARATGRADAATADPAQIGFAVTVSFGVATVLLICAVALVRPARGA